MQIRKAERRQAKIKMGLQGPSGAGKTYSALLISKGLVNDFTKVAIIDTENSADLYAHLGDYNVLHLSPPFNPEKYCKALEICIEAGMEVIILDSLSHEWEGAGGILETHGNMMGNSFTNWGKLTPRHNTLIQAIQQAPVHIICTMRSKQDYVLVQKDGKHIPQKMGLKAIQRDGMDYELTLVLEIDMKHLCKASKDRTSLFMNRPEFKISEQTGQKILKWCTQGTPIEQVKELINNAPNLIDLKLIYNKYPEYKAQLKDLVISRQQQLLSHSKTQSNGTTTSI